MYTVYIDDKVAYSPLLANEGYSIMAGKVIVELNKAGSFEFTLPPNNVMYDNVNKLKSIVRVITGDKPSYELKNTEKTYKTMQSSIPTTVLYRTAIIDDETGEITLDDVLDDAGTSTYDIYSNYKTYSYFYGDRADGK